MSGRPTPHDVRMKLDQRIHNQRVALRGNWEIIERRTLERHRMICPNRYVELMMRLHRENVDLRAQLARQSHVEREG